MSALKWPVAILTTLAVLITYFTWLNGHDEAVMKAGEAYRACVEAQYHMSPSAYSALHGSFPTCESR